MPGVGSASRLQRRHPRGFGGLHMSSNDAEAGGDAAEVKAALEVLKQTGDDLDSMLSQVCVLLLFFLVVRLCMFPVVLCMCCKRRFRHRHHCYSLTVLTFSLTPSLVSLTH